MCGIIGYIGPRAVVPLIVDGLKKLEYRGYDSAGIAVVGDGEVRVRRVQGKISAWRGVAGRASPSVGAYGIGHTRWATHGRPSEENAHPHRDCTGRIVIVHNGIIENYLALKAELKAEGHVFKTETDTEVIVHLIEKHFRGDLEAAFRAAIARLEGAFAVAAIAADDPGRIVAAKTGPPAVVGLGEGETFLSSDINPILAYTQESSFWRTARSPSSTAPGPASPILGRPLKKAEVLAWNPMMIEKRGFKHFMLKEIYEQPEVVRDTLAGRTSLDTGEVKLDEIAIPPEVCSERAQGVIIACGTSYHAGMVGKYLMESLARVPTDVEFASEYRYRDFILDKDTLVIVVSQSGETADTLAALRLAQDKAAAVLAVTNSVAPRSPARRTACSTPMPGPRSASRRPRRSPPR